MACVIEAGCLQEKGPRRLRGGSATRGLASVGGGGVLDERPRAAERDGERDHLPSNACVMRYLMNTGAEAERVRERWAKELGDLSPS